MSHVRIADAAQFLGVSDDTVRRWISAGALTSTTDPSGTSSSARNRFVGLVTAVKADAVMAQVEMQCGPFRVVSLMSSEAVDELGLEPGSVAVAVIKSTNVIIESLEGSS